jgi:hypothetical protein
MCFGIFIVTDFVNAWHRFLLCVSVPRLCNKIPSITRRQLAVRDSRGRFVVEGGVSL